MFNQQTGETNRFNPGIDSICEFNIFNKSDRFTGKSGDSYGLELIKRDSYSN